MGEFNIYNEILDFSDFIHLFLNKGKKITLEKNEYFCRAEENFPFVAYLEKGAFRYTCDDSDGKEHILSYAFENEILGAIIRLCRIIVTQFLIYKLFKVPSYIHFLYLR